jgi:hypothetical protein
MDEDTGTNNGWLKEYKERRRRALPLCAPEWKRALENQQFAAGLKQWEGEDEKLAKLFKFACLTIPEISPIIDTASGRQILSRFERVYVPYSSQHADWAELLSELDRAFMKSVDADIEESEAFRDGPCVQGLAAVRWLYSTRTGEKQILVENQPIWQFLWPVDEARKMNLVDRNWQIFGEWYPLDEAIQLWDEHEKELRIHRGVGWPFARDEMSSRVEWEGQPGTSEHGPVSPGRQKMVFIEHYEWRSLEEAFRVYLPNQDPQALQAAAARGVPPPPGPPVGVMVEDELALFLETHKAETGQDYPPELIVPVEQDIYRFAKVVGGSVVLEEGRIPIDDFTFEFLTGQREPGQDKTLWRAMVDRLKDAQRWVNLYLSSMARIFQANPKGTLLIERGVFRNRSEAARQWASPSSLIEIERGRLSGPNKPYEFLGGKDSPAFRMAETLMSYAREAMPRLVGFNPGALGQLGPDLRRISGEVLRGVQDAAIAGNANAYDAYGLYRRRGGRKFMRFLKEYFDESDVLKVVGDKAFRTDPQTGQQTSVIPPKHMWDPVAIKGVEISESGPTPDQKRSQWQGLVESGGLQALLQPHPMTGWPILDQEDVVEMIPDLPEHRRDKIIARHQERMAQAMAAQQQQQGQPQPLPPQGA